MANLFFESNDTSPDFNDSEDLYHNQTQSLDIGMAIHLYGVLIFLAVGVVCNTLSFLVILRVKPFNACSISMLSLAAIDIAALVAKPLWIFTFFDYIPWRNVTCGALVFFLYFTEQLSNWILVTLTVQRFVAVVFPFHVKDLFRGRRVYILNGAVALALALIHVHYFWTTNNCDVNPSLLAYIIWINMSSHVFLPMLILAVLNTVIVCKLRQAAALNIGRSEHKQPSAQSHLIVGITVLYLIVTAPYCSYIIYVDYFAETSNGIIDSVVFLVSDSTHVLNFFFYFIAGRTFRREFYRLFCRSKLQKGTGSSDSQHGDRSSRIESSYI